MPVPFTPFNPFNWYWFVAGDQSRAYSSAAGGYVLAGDPTFLAWLSVGNRPTNIDTETSLSDVLSQVGLPPVAGVAVSDTQKNSLFDNVPQAVKVWALAVDNRVRVLEGQPTRTAAQFRTYVKSLM